MRALPDDLDPETGRAAFDPGPTTTPPALGGGCDIVATAVGVALAAVLVGLIALWRWAQ